MECTFIHDPAAYLMRCTRCGRTLRIGDPSLAASRYHAWCRASTPRKRRSRQRWQLGTAITRALAAVRYTKDRHQRLRLWLGLDEECGCGKREAALNRWGARMGKRLGTPAVWLRDRWQEQVGDRLRRRQRQRRRKV